MNKIRRLGLIAILLALIGVFNTFSMDFNETSKSGASITLQHLLNGANLYYNTFNNSSSLGKIGLLTGPFVILQGLREIDKKLNIYNNVSAFIKEQWHNFRIDSNNAVINILKSPVNVPLNALQYTTQHMRNNRQFYDDFILQKLFAPTLGLSFTIPLTASIIKSLQVKEALTKLGYDSIGQQTIIGLVHLLSGSMIGASSYYIPRSLIFKDIYQEQLELMSGKSTIDPESGKIVQKSDVNMNDVVLPDHLQAMVENIKINPKSVPATTLFYGPPGTMKTTCCEKIAYELGATRFNDEFIFISSAMISNSQFAGVAGERIKKYIRMALEYNGSGVLVFLLDEIHNLTTPLGKTDHAGGVGLDKGDVCDLVRQLFDTINKRGDGKVRIFATTNDPKRIDDRIMNQIHNRTYMGIAKPEERYHVITTTLKRLGYTIEHQALDFIVSYTEGSVVRTITQNIIPTIMQCFVDSKNITFDASSRKTIADILKPYATNALENEINERDNIKRNIKNNKKEESTNTSLLKNLQEHEKNIKSIENCLYQLNKENLLHEIKELSSTDENIRNNKEKLIQLLEEYKKDLPKTTIEKKFDEVTQLIDNINDINDKKNYSENRDKINKILIEFDSNKDFQDKLDLDVEVDKLTKLETYFADKKALDKNLQAAKNLIKELQNTLIYVDESYAKDSTIDVAQNLSNAASYIEEYEIKKDDTNLNNILVSISSIKKEKKHQNTELKNAASALIINDWDTHVKDGKNTKDTKVFKDNIKQNLKPLKKTQNIKQKFVNDTTTILNKNDLDNNDLQKIKNNIDSSWQLGSVENDNITKLNKALQHILPPKYHADIETEMLAQDVFGTIEKTTTQEIRQSLDNFAPIRAMIAYETGGWQRFASTAGHWFNILTLGYFKKQASQEELEQRSRAQLIYHTYLKLHKNTSRTVDVHEQNGIVNLSKTIAKDKLMGVLGLVNSNDNNDDFKTLRANFINSIKGTNTDDLTGNLSNIKLENNKITYTNNISIDMDKKYLAIQNHLKK